MTSNRVTLFGGLAVVVLVASGCAGSQTGTPAAAPSSAATTTTVATPPAATTEAPAADPSPTCVDDSVVQDAVASLDPFNGFGWKVSKQGDPCATLSWVDAHIEGAMAASPVTILFFHDNTYLGTATSESYSFTSVESQTDDTVTVSYRWLRDGEATSQLSGGPASIRYQWDGSSVQMLDELPPEVTDREGYADSTSAPAQPDSCVTDSTIQGAVSSLPELFDGGGWNVVERGNPCATLSWAKAFVYGATGSSPVAVLFFNQNTYLGTATSKSYGFTDVVAESDDTVTASYGWLLPGESTASHSGGPALVRYHWDGSSVQMLDQLPVEVTG
ncbi:hypothetical protein GCM10007304_13090 [Rhodococcoides trifolii]|uniref:LppP/LprE family lipoprotein n=1 Tax=Rhodococcoides trifolii TaxID=908250 RepID=A0A917FQV9_9NOCA|nr:LppP/LprE family lipoprotein [Rhodococcus trifolii]GGG00544.1 hypothetical protein GCM10007304_13090 [Rhodococcus trifolii]